MNDRKIDPYVLERLRIAADKALPALLRRIAEMEKAAAKTNG